MTLKIELPDEMERYINEQVAKLGYKDASEYLASVLEAEQHRRTRDEIEQMLVEGIESPSTPLTAGDFDDVRREGLEIIHKRRAK